MNRRNDWQMSVKQAVGGMLLAMSLLSIVGVLGVAAGCDSQKQTPIPVAPGAVYTGPSYLRQTIGSMATVDGTGDLAVSGYGLVVNLPGTGSPEVPAFLRQKMINMVRRLDLNKHPQLRGVSPEAFLRRTDNAIVQVTGRVPPGSPVGTPFDLVVQAMPDDNTTTSLAGGLLIPMDLSPGGANRQGLYTGRTAEGQGPIFANPIFGTQADERGQGTVTDFQRTAVVAAGGRVSEARKLRLILNQPSFSMSAAIADRINEVLVMGPTERGKTANAINETTIDLKVPARYAQKTNEFINLVAYTFLDARPVYQQAKASDLFRRIKADQVDEGLPEATVFVLRAMGKTVLPYIRGYYQDANLNARWTALQAGAALQDELAVEPLIELAESGDTVRRAQVAQALSRLPRSRRANVGLAQLINDPQTSVRVAAYSAMSRSGHPGIERLGVYGDGELKFVLDRLPQAKEPLVYVSQDLMPRIVLFGYDIDLPAPMIARYWDSRLMIKTQTAPLPMTIEAFGREVLVRESKTALPAEIYYRPYDETQGRVLTIDATVANTAILLGHQPSAKRPQEGLNLSYSEVVEVLYRLSEDGLLQVPVELNISPLIAMLSAPQTSEEVIERRETQGADATDAAAQDSGE